MQIETRRFGTITLNQDQLFLFPGGLVGMETLRDWAMLPDLENPSVAWLQSASRGDRALPVISPRAFFEDYRIQISRRELGSLHLKPGAEVYVLTTISGHPGKLTTNLRSPIVLNLSRRLGCQLITDNEQPIHQRLPLTYSLANSTESDSPQPAQLTIDPSSSVPGSDGHLQRVA